MTVRNILVLYTGGTIGMQRNEKGVYVPKEDTFLDHISNIDRLNTSNRGQHGEYTIVFNGCEVFYKIHEYDKLIDSSNISTKEWKQMAKDIEDNYGNYDGFVILHGTDTLAYTSSVLSFMLEGLSKPVILTGAQIPIYEANTDGIDNIYWSLYFASRNEISEVCVYFGGKLLRGNRCTKTDTSNFAGFDSPNFNALATVNVKENKVLDTQWKQENLLIPKSNKSSSLVINKNLNEHIGVFYFTPTTIKQDVEKYLEVLKGLVILTYGNGNLNNNADGVIEALSDGIKNGIVIINITQCLKGSVTSKYSPGKELNSIGVISGNDMTIEAAYAKLVVMLNTSTEDNLKTNIRGEMSDNE